MGRLVAIDTIKMRHIKGAHKSMKIQHFLLENPNMRSFLGIFALLAISNAKQTPSPDERIVPRQLDEFATNTMRENGELRAAAPECKGQLG